MRKNKRNRQNSNTAVKVQPKYIQDSFSNPIARLGMFSQSLINGTQYPLTRLTRDYNLMTSLYRNSWIVKKIINTIPEDMCKNWFDITSDITPEQQDRINRLERRTLIKEKILKGLYWGRLYGGAAGIMLIDGHEDRLAEPLDIDDVLPNTFKGLLILDRWSGIYPNAELITDINSPEFGLPESYNIVNSNGQLSATVHHSRILRFPGRELPFWEDQAEVHWGASEIEHIFDELQKRDNTSWNIANLVFQANLRILKKEDLAAALTTLDEQGVEDLYKTLQMQNWLMNNSSMQILSKDDEFQSIQYTFVGLNDIYESFMLDISGACDIPVTRLFGRAPAGLNSTGESDLQNYYDMIAQQQESRLRPVLNKLLPVMFMSELGFVPDDLDVKFNPVRTPSDKEIADLVQQKGAAIVEAYNAGIIDRPTAMKEYQQMSYTTNMFTNITDEAIAKAEQDEELEGPLFKQAEAKPGFSTPSADIMTTDGDFKEEEHPRDEDGKFAKIGSKGKGSKNSLDKIEREAYNKAIVGIKTSKGTEVKKISKHAFKRIFERKIKIAEISNALVNPEYTVPGHDKEEGPTTVYKKGDTRVIVTDKTGVILTITRRSVLNVKND